jgi:hypothetical protein
MTRIYHSDTTYEQEAEDGTVTASVELRIYYTVTWGREATRDEPGYGDTAEFHSVGVEIGSTRKYRDLSPSKSLDMDAMADSTLYWWAEAFVDDHQAELIADDADLEQGEREAAADYRGERS